MSDENTSPEEEQEFRPLDVTMDAILHAETAQEKLDVLAFATGVPVEQAIWNIAGSATEKAVRLTLVSVMSSLLEQGQVEPLVEILEAIAGYDYAERGIPDWSDSLLKSSATWDEGLDNPVETDEEEKL